jgi:hypothetical protein
MLPGIVRLVNINRSAAFLFRYGYYSSCFFLVTLREFRIFTKTIAFRRVENQKKMASTFHWLFWFPSGIGI